MLYTAKCYWPGVTEDGLRDAADRAHQQNKADDRAVFRGLLYLQGDDTALSLFEADSAASVKQVSESVGMPCERVIATVWVAPDLRGGSRCSSD
ncbi:MAG TPA: hypothetical protein VKB43_11815 [Gaiellaceae bacterium]|nr:hypothetical protein [Gaiellaceae bacterium]